MKNTGRLSVRVYTSQAELPVEGATVVVTRKGTAGKYDLLSVQITDSSGLIESVEIETPGRYESTTPHMQEQEKPFALCNVWAEHPGYAMLQVEGVQIFSGVETIQDMMMIPLAEGKTSLQNRDMREVMPQSL